MDIWTGKIAQINPLIKCNHRSEHIIINCTDKHSYSLKRNKVIVHKKAQSYSSQINTQMKCTADKLSLTLHRCMYVDTNNHTQLTNKRDIKKLHCWLNLYYGVSVYPGYELIFYLKIFIISFKLFAIYYWSPQLPLVGNACVYKYALVCHRPTFIAPGRHLSIFTILMTQKSERPQSHNIK